MNDNTFKNLWNETIPDKKKRFERLPDGKYKGIVTIQEGKVEHNGENKGRAKFVFVINVCEGEHKGKNAYFNHVLFPAHLDQATQKKDDEQYREAVIKYHRQTKKMLEICGVDVYNIFDYDDLIAKAPQQANGNKVYFTVRNMGESQKVYFDATAEVEENDHARLFLHLPDGSDAPFGGVIGE